MKTLKFVTAILLTLSGTTLMAQPAAPHGKPGAKAMRGAPAKTNNLTPPASQEQIDAAERTLFGDYECEFNQAIHVSLDPKAAGYIEVKFKNSTYTMKPVLSSTGALRLEDVRGQTLLLQIANKSMLMDVKAGKRLVDSCTHATQKAFNNNAQPTPSVIN